MRYVYEGPGPDEDPHGGGLTRPGDVRDFDAEPDWGPWRLLDDPPRGPESDSPGSGVTTPAPTPETTGAASVASPVTTSTATPEGM